MNDIRKLIVEAGGVLKDRFYHIITHKTKAKHDLVSDVDLEIEKLVSDKLRTLNPEIAIYSEEKGRQYEVSGNKRWILDPIDGTANFIFGIPYFSISLALEENDEITQGYVYNPITDEFYHSSLDSGKSYINNSEICTSTTSAIESALFVFGFSANYKNIERYHKDWLRFFDNCRKGLGLLSPSLNICNVARGRFDCFVDFGSSMEGQAAASLILKNAGGALMNYDLSNWQYKITGVVASNGNIKLAD